MALLSSIEIIINNNPFRNFQKVVISQNLYGTDRFEIICRYDALEDLDGFLIENSKDFLGYPIVIQTRFLKGEGESDGISFLGYVTEIESSRSAMADSDLVIISGGSKEIILNRKPHNRAFSDKTLDEILKEILADYELRPKVKARNQQRFPYIVQFEESDLAFIRRLSIRYGEWFFFNGSELIFGEIPEEEKTLTIGQNLDNFRYGLRVAPVKFNLTTLEPLSVSVQRYHSGNSSIESNLNTYGKHALNMSKVVYPLEGEDYFEHLNLNEDDYQSGLNSVGELQESADAVNLAHVSGDSTNGTLSAGNYATIDCLKKDGDSKMSYGKYLLTSVRHYFDNTLAYKNNFTAIPAETAIPENTNPYFVRRSSNQLGLVADNRDPENLGRIKISFFWMEDKFTTPWVRVVTPYSNVKSGFYFIPAKDSRILVGFEDGDVEKPYCLGALFDKNVYPDPDWSGNYDEGNAKIHAIRTSKGQTIELHDENGAEKIRIYDTSGNNELELNSADKTINIRTNGDMSISAGGTLKISASNIEIKASGNIDMSADNKLGQNALDINSTATANMKLNANNIKASADVLFEAKGGATAEVSSSGQTTVKGTIVKIN